MAVCRRNSKCIAHLNGFISDREYYSQVPTPMPLDRTGDGARKRADEQRAYFLEQRAKEKAVVDPAKNPAILAGNDELVGGGKCKMKMRTNFRHVIVSLIAETSSFLGRLFK